MVTDLLKRLFGKTQNDGDARPPKPDASKETEEYERTRYQATIEYRNGDVESFECYGIYSRGDDTIRFNTDPYGYVSYGGSAGHSYDRRTENYEVLAREPVLEEVGTDTFVLSYRVDYEWKTPQYAGYGKSKEWIETHKDVKLTVERGN